MQTKNKRSLGPFIAKYKDRQFKGIDLITLFIPGFLAFAIPAAYGAYLAYSAYGNYGKAAAISWAYPWVILSGIAFLIYFVLIVYRIAVSHRYVAIYQNGVRISLQQKQTLLWDEISGISTEVIQKRFLFLKSRLNYRAIIYSSSGKKYKLHSKIENLSMFISRFKKVFYAIITPATEQQLFKGKNVFFGKVSIDRDYFIANNKKYQWSLINQVTVNSGRLVVEFTDHSKIKIPTSKIQNIELLLQLIKLGDNP